MGSPILDELLDFDMQMYPCPRFNLQYPVENLLFETYIYSCNKKRDIVQCAVE